MFSSFDYKLYLNRVLKVFRRFRYTAVAVLIVAVFALAVFRVNAHTSVKRNQELYDTKLLEIKNVNFDQDTLERIFELRDLDVDIKSIFPDNRTNPFN